MPRIAFISAIPQNVFRGSGAYTGIRTLREGMRAAGVNVELFTPQVHLPVFTAEQLLFNAMLIGRRWRDYDATVGFDVDGFTIACRTGRPHIANIKGVLGDAVPYERGLTRAAMSLQARWEKLHVHRAGMVITISEYCARRLRDLYGFKGNIGIVPEMIDLAAWRERLLQTAPAPKDGRFTVLCVCRFYPRKRVHLLLQAAEILRGRMPELQVRIAGGGPEAPRLRRIWRERRLESVVTWITDPSEQELKREYHRADVFCLPSVQEGFGIVLLEAMASGKPIVAARAAAIPEVVRSGILVEPDDAEALADGIAKLYFDTDLRRSLAMSGANDVERYDSPRVTREFLRQIDIAM